MEYLQDYDFLKRLDQEQVKTQYVRINILNAYDQTLSSIEGIATNGSLSINTNAAVRRSGSLTLITTDENKNITNLENDIAINKRISLQIGLKNTLADYANHNIIWFPLGVFIIVNASINRGTNGATINISFKDKMVLLNGEVGGALSGAITHSPIYVAIDDATKKYEKSPVKLYTLLYEALTELGGLRSDEIIIENIETRIRNIVRWIGTDPIWGQKKGNSWHFSKTEIAGGNKYTSGMDIGYANVDFVYPTEKDLTTSVGGNICQILDAIKKLLGNYEYFFDIDGIFHFQEIRNGLTRGSAKSNLAEAIGDKYLAEKSSDLVRYSFTNSMLVSSYSNNPQYANIKNAFMVWGERPESKLPIRYHLVIDTPPVIGGSFSVYLKEEKWYINDEKYSYMAASNTGSGAKTVITLSPQDDWRLQLYLEMITGQRNPPYKQEFITEFPKYYDIIAKAWRYPQEELNYYFDMLDPIQTGHPVVASLGVNNIGYRLKSKTEKNVNTLFAPATTVPDITFIEQGKSDTTALIQEAVDKNQDYLIVDSEFYKNLSIGSAMYPAIDYIRGNLHESISYNNSISLSCMPIYYLEPGWRIYVSDTKSDIDGDFIIQSISLPLATNGMMSISATRANERI